MCILIYSDVDEDEKNSALCIPGPSRSMSLCRQSIGCKRIEEQLDEFLTVSPQSYGE